MYAYSHHTQPYMRVCHVNRPIAFLADLHQFFGNILTVTLTPRTPAQRDALSWCNMPAISVTPTLSVGVSESVVRVEVRVEVNLEAWVEYTGGQVGGREHTRPPCKIQSARSRAGTSPWLKGTRTGCTPASIHCRWRWVFWWRWRR